MKRACVSQGMCFWGFAGRWHRTIRIRIRIAAASHDTMPLSAESKPWKAQEESTSKKDAKSVWNPLFSSVSRASTSSTFLREAREAPSQKKGLEEGWPRKCATCLQNGIFLKSPISRISDHTQFCAKKRSPFHALKQVVSEDPARLLTLPGPLINS